MTSAVHQRTISQHNPDQHSENCIICLGNINNKSFVDSCFHYFCQGCIWNWMKKRAVCPLCLQAVDFIIIHVKSDTEYQILTLDEFLAFGDNKLHSVSNSNGDEGNSSLSDVEEEGSTLFGQSSESSRDDDGEYDEERSETSIETSTTPSQYSDEESGPDISLANVVLNSPILSGSSIDEVLDMHESDEMESEDNSYDSDTSETEDSESGLGKILSTTSASSSYSDQLSYITGDDEEA